jgi:small conductance mechanosensitive channel
MWDWTVSNIGPISSAAFALLLGWFLARLASRAIKNWLPLSPSARNVAPLLAQAVRYSIIIFAIVTALTFLGVPSASIITVVGAAGLAIALALQNTLSNIAAGIMLIWLKPIAIGEYIVGDGIAGVVVEIGLFGTRLRSTSGLYVYSNNNRIWNGPITNHSREPKRRMEINFTLPETIDVERIRDYLLGVAAKNPNVLQDPPPSVHVESFAGDKIVLQLRGWAPTVQYQDTLRSLAEHAKAALNRVLARKGGKAEASIANDPHAATASVPAPEDQRRPEGEEPAR